MHADSHTVLDSHVETIRGISCELDNTTGFLFLIVKSKRKDRMKSLIQVIQRIGKGRGIELFVNKHANWRGHIETTIGFSTKAGDKMWRIVFGIDPSRGILWFYCYKKLSRKAMGKTYDLPIHDHSLYVDDPMPEDKDARETPLASINPRNPKHIDFIRDIINGEWHRWYQ